MHSAKLLYMQSNITLNACLLRMNICIWLPLFSVWLDYNIVALALIPYEVTDAILWCQGGDAISIYVSILLSLTPTAGFVLIISVRVSWPGFVLMVGQSRRRWYSVGTELGRLLVFAGLKFIFVCVCMYVYMYVYIYIYVYMRIHIVYVCVCGFMDACVYTWICGSI